MMKKLRAAIFLSILAGILLFAVSCSGGEVAATINGEKITLEQLDANVAAMQRQFAAQGQMVPDEEMGTFRSNVLDNLVKTRLLLEYAKDHGYEAGSDEVAAQITAIQGQFGSKDEYLSALEQQGYTEKTLKQEIGNGMTVEGMLAAEVIDKIVVTAADVETFYNENPDLFVLPESVTARHIIVTLEDDATREDREKALKKIEDIRQEIVDGADFASVARERSEGPSASSGGSLGTFGRGQMVPAFEEAAFAIEPGELSGVVESEFGFHIIVVSEKIPAGVQSLQDAEASIRQHLMQVREQEDVEKFVEELELAADIEIFERVDDEE